MNRPERSGTGRGVLIIDAPERTAAQHPWVAFTVVEDGGAWIERTQRPLDGWEATVESVKPASHRTRARDAVRVSVRPSGHDLDRIAQAMAEPAEGMALAWESREQMSIHDARRGLARAMEHTVDAQDARGRVETVLRSALEEIQGTPERTPRRPAKSSPSPIKIPNVAMRYMLGGIVVTFGLAMVIQAAHDATYGVVRAGDWSARPATKHAEACHDRARSAIKTLRKQEKAIRETTRGTTDTRTRWTHDATPATWEELGHESTRQDRYVVSAGRSYWAQGWLDPKTGDIRLVIGQDPSAGTLGGTLDTENWPECIREPHDP